MNNENQNLNNVTNGVPANTNVGNVVPPNPTTVPVTPVVPPQPVNPVPATPTTVDTVTPTPVNLQPEGVVQPVVPTPVAPAAPEPLMATNLNPNEVSAQPVADQTAAPQPVNGVVQPVSNPAMPPMGVAVPPTNANNNIGMLGGVPVPPTPTVGQEPPKKEKKKPNLILLIVLAVVLVGAIGYGVYYFLNQSKANAAVTITPILSDEIELGTTLVNLVNSYVRVSGVSITECNLETDVDTTVVGEYTWTVTCGSVSTGTKTVTVRDTSAPEVELQDVTVVPGTTVEPEDFILSVTDASGSSSVTYEFEDEDSFDVNTEGTYEVDIVVSDAYDNEVVVTGNLTVDDDAPIYNLVCQYEDVSENYADAIVSISYEYEINSSSELYGQDMIIVYTFDEETYEAALADVTDDGFDTYEGTVTTNDEDYTITIVAEVTTRELATEFELSSFPTTDAEIETLHTSRGDSCRVVNR